MSGTTPDDEKIYKVMGVLLDKTESEINNMTVQDFNRQAKQISFVFGADIPGKPEKYFKANGRTYAINYRVDKIRWAQYVEIKSFLQGGCVPNLHKLMASIVVPVKRFLWFKFPQKNDSDMHEVVAEDMLKARFIDLYHSCLFFYQLYKSSMEIIKGYLVKELSMKIPMEQAMTEATNLMTALDGFMQPNALQSTRG